MLKLEFPKDLLNLDRYTFWFISMTYQTALTPTPKFFADNTSLFSTVHDVNLAANK